ncbi:hypothetical protein ACHAXA_009762 [Cyclostephanos tholiformis]|uniref:Uncharacterized protein n=1 Tax=Cyclostephanos tholiformis TaxID=382380 RepID=A0ABD3SH91_9STRA
MVTPTTALNGDVSLSAFKTYSGWRSFEVITQGDLVGGYKVPGQFDGIGGHVHHPNEFGLGHNRGFVDTFYIFGEEEDYSYGNGRFFAISDKTIHIITGIGTGNESLLQGGTNGLGRDALENAAQVDMGETKHVALFLSPDYGQQILRLYIGQKGFKSDGTSCGNCTGDALLLARNGLAFGSWFIFKAAYLVAAHQIAALLELSVRVDSTL